MLPRSLEVAVLTLLLCGAGLSAQAAGAPTCVPAAAVEGGGPLRAEVIEELRRRGISTNPVYGCASVTARIGEASPGVVLSIVDAYGRTSERTANGPV